MDPIRAVAYLVNDLVDRLVRFIRAQHARLALIQLPVGVSAKKRRAAICCPGRTMRSGHARGCVVEGAQHACDVPPRRIWSPSLSHSLSRFALEVDDLPARRGTQRL